MAESQLEPTTEEQHMDLYKGQNWTDVYMTTDPAGNRVMHGVDPSGEEHLMHLVDL